MFFHTDTQKKPESEKNIDISLTRIKFKISTFWYHLRFFPLDYILIKFSSQKIFCKGIEVNRLSQFFNPVYTWKYYIYLQV